MNVHDDDEPTYLELVEHVMAVALREATFQAAAVSALTPEIAAAASSRDASPKPGSPWRPPEQPTDITL
jgi:hypothetical protein